ncbi:hypothetical protein HanRHA438_Chr09g0384211 [Helianthus annuus]|nr:hypothetical protein HanRHA438_Chr09g0384211 [Helianthus annuus]
MVPGTGSEPVPNYLNRNIFGTVRYGHLAFSIPVFTVFIFKYRSVPGIFGMGADALFWGFLVPISVPIFLYQLVPSSSLTLIFLSNSH